MLYLSLVTWLLVGVCCIPVSTSIVTTTCYSKILSLSAAYTASSFVSTTSILMASTGTVCSSSISTPENSIATSGKVTGYFQVTLPNIPPHPIHIFLCSYYETLSCVCRHFYSYSRHTYLTLLPTDKALGIL